MNGTTKMMYDTMPDIVKRMKKEGKNEYEILDYIQSCKFNLELKKIAVNKKNFGSEF